LGAYPIDIAANGINALILAYTIFRYNLLDITVVIRKGLLYTVPTVIIGVGYFLIILISVSLFHLVTGYQVFVVSVLVAAGVSLVMQPLQAKTQQWIDRLFFRERYDAGLMLERLSRTASSVLDLERLVNLILDETTATIHISKLALFLADEETGLYRLVAQRGLPADTRIDMRSDHPAVRWLQQHHGILTRHRLEILPQFKALWARERKDLQSLEAEIFVPLIAHNELIGLLVLGPKLSETSYTEEDGRTLMTLANQTAIAIQNARLYQTAIEEKIRSEVLVEHAFAGMIVVDQEMRIVNMNPAAEQVTGFTAQDLVGKTIFKVFGPEMWREGSSLRQAVQEGKTLPPTELSLATPAGRRDILLGMTPILDGYLFNFTDITKIKEFSRLQANIVANVSHELRTPLASIKGYTELLLEDYGTDDPESQRQFLQIIENEADRMGRIVKDLLDISRLEARSAKLPMEPVSLGDVVEETLMALSVQARKADVSLVSDLAPDAPPLRANKELMLSIVHNLVSNAIKYSHPGGQVDVVVRPEDGHVVLQVIDRGLGIPKADLPHLFTKFYRSGMAQKKGIRGTGLGLALVKEAVSVHKGRIDVQSQEGKGTTFTVWFPLATREDRSEPVPTPEQVLESIQPSRPGSS
ncbi:MAG: PAS domain S-box protein, partial [Caldilineae bacterium]